MGQRSSRTCTAHPLQPARRVQPHPRARRADQEARHDRRRHHRPRQPVRGRSSSTASARRPGSTRSSATRRTSPPASRSEKKAAAAATPYSHLTLLAKNATGFKNLIKLSSLAFLEGFYYNPRIDRELLEAHSEGLICLSGCLAGEFNQFILKDQPTRPTKLAEWFAKLFGNDFYIEIQNNGIGAAGPVHAGRRRTSPTSSACRSWPPPTPTTSAQDDADAHDVLFCINTGKKRDPREAVCPKSRCRTRTTSAAPEDMYRLFPGYEDAVARSQEIADGVDIQLDFKKRHFPVFTTAREARRPKTTCANCASRAEGALRRRPRRRSPWTGSTTSSASSAGWASPATS